MWSEERKVRNSETMALKRMCDKQPIHNKRFKKLIPAENKGKQQREANKGAERSQDKSSVFSKSYSCFE